MERYNEIRRVVPQTAAAWGRLRHNDQRATSVLSMRPPSWLKTPAAMQGTEITSHVFAEQRKRCGRAAFQNNTAVAWFAEGRRSSSTGSTSSRPETTSAASSHHVSAAPRPVCRCRLLAVLCRIGSCVQKDRRRHGGSEDSFSISVTFVGPYL